MSRTLTLKMDPFGVKAFQELASRQGNSIDETLRMAAHYYLADSDQERLGWAVRSLVPPNGPRRQRVQLEVRLDDETWTALAREARRQRVAVGILTAHAVLYFMADVDSGRLAERMEGL